MSTNSENSVAVPFDDSIVGLGPIVFAVFAAALAGLLFGYDTGVASGIQGYLQSYFHLSNTQLVLQRHKSSRKYSWLADEAFQDPYF